MKILLLTLLLASCRSPAQKPSGDRLGELAEKVRQYIELGQSEKDANGWILPGNCDGLLHNALAYLGGLVDYEVLKLAEQAPGRWTRTPKGDCLSTGRSKSSISRDMVLGVILAAVDKGDKDLLVRLKDYVAQNDFIMGEHDGSVDGRWRVMMTPSLYKTLIDSISYLSGLKLTEPARLYEVDFTDHLEAISFYLKSRISGGALPGGIDTMRFLSEEDPNNALYLALRAKYDPNLGGLQDAAINVLLREDLFPSERLPTSEDRCVSYLWEHGENEGDCTPCPAEKKTHPGHDLLFAAHVIYHQTIKGE